jgi:hypothetical protein
MSHLVITDKHGNSRTMGEALLPEYHKAMDSGENPDFKLLGDGSQQKPVVMHSAKLRNSPNSTLFNNIWVTVWLLDSLGGAGYVCKREQARRGLLDKAMQMPMQDVGSRGFISTAMMAAHRSGAVVSTHRMLSRKKGRQYGEGHQKALQISVRLLSLVGISRWERVRVLPGFRGPSAMLGICVCMPLLPCGWESAFFPTRRQCRKECDGLSDHEAAEMASLTLLLRGRLCRWRSYGRL